MSKYTLSKSSLSKSSLKAEKICSSLSLILLWGAILIQPVVAQTQSRKLRTLSVKGHGVETIAATLSQVNLGVEVQGKTAQEVQKEVARRSQAVVQLLKSLQVKKLTTSGISLNPVYSFKNDVRRLTGYIATNTVSFQVPTEKAGQILDESVKSGATRIGGISFTATDPAITKAKKEAIREATQDAQARANAVLDSLGFSSKEIVGIQVDDATAQPPPVFRAESARIRTASSDVITPVIGGEQKVEATVTLQISY